MPRTYRKRKDWPNPEKPHDHESNRLDPKFSSRIPKRTDAMIRSFLESAKGTKKHHTNEAWLDYLRKNGFDVDGFEYE